MNNDQFSIIPKKAHTITRRKYDNSNFHVKVTLTYLKVLSITFPLGLQF